MNLLIAPQRSLALPSELPHQPPLPRPSLPDRIALAIGLRLLLWGSRSRLVPDREHHARRREQERRRAAREQLWLSRALQAPLR